MSRELSKEDIDAIAVMYRQQERVQYSQAEANLPTQITDPDLIDASKKMLNDIYLELHHRRIARAIPMKDFEAHHENSIAREAFVIKLVETEDAEAAGDFMRRRIGLTETMEQFLGSQVELLEEYERELDDANDGMKGP